MIYSTCSNFGCIVIVRLKYLFVKINFTDTCMTIIIEVRLFKINVTETLQKVCIWFLTLPPPFGITFHFLATLNFIYGP